jgi:CHRD domain
MKLFSGCVLSFVLLAGAAQAQDYLSMLSGSNETPPNASTATGKATFHLNGDNTLTYSVATTGVTGTASHIHIGPAGVAGSIIFPLAGGPTNWAGTTGVLTAAQLTALNNTGLYVNVHSAAFPGGEIRDQLRPVKLFKGSSHVAMGGASLAIGPTGGLVVSNIGSSGQDGVECAMWILGTGKDGPWSEFSTQGDFDPATMPVGSLVTQNAIGAGEKILSTSCVQANASGNFTALIDFAPAGSPTYTCNVFDGTTLVASQSGLHSGDVHFGAAASKYKLECETSLETSCCPLEVKLVLTWKIVKKSAPVDVAGMIVQGNVLQFVPDVDPGNVAIAAIRLTGQGVSSFTIDSEAVGALGHLNTALGNVSLSPPAPGMTGDDGLKVAGLGSTMQDGVECALGPADSCDLGWDTIDPGAPVGAAIRAHATGTIGGVPDQPLGDLTITKTATAYDVSVDFSSIGSSTQTVQVYNGGSLVTSFPGHSGPVGSMSKWPKGLGKLGGILECFISHDPPGTLFVINGSTFVGDELRVLAEGTSSGIDAKTAFAVTAANIPPLVITSEVSAPSPFTDIGFALAGVNGNPHLVGSGTLVGGSLNAFSLDHAAAFAPSIMLVSLASTPVPFKGGFIATIPIALQIPLFTGATGSLSLPFAMPVGLPAFTFYVQCGIVDGAAIHGVSLSNCVRANAP